MNIFIEPSDVWLFRDGRPFMAGEDHVARSLFPPTPRTMQGVIRSARLAYGGASFTNRATWPPDVGTPDDFGALQMRGPLIARCSKDGAKPFFPHPQDAVKLKDGWHVLSPQQVQSFQANWSDVLQPLMPPRYSEPEKFELGWLSADELANYLSGKKFDVTDSKSLFDREHRFSVEIEGIAKRSREGNLFAIEFIRPHQDVGLLLEIAGVTLPEGGLLALGGEARAGSYKTVATGLDLPRDGRMPHGAGEKTRFKLYFATPAIFDQGWLPRDIGTGTLHGIWRGIDLTLVSAAVGKPQHIGGFDMAANNGRGGQKPMRRAVPAGSVYFFETADSAANVMAAFDGKCVSDVDPQIGFGLCYVGDWGNVREV